MTSLRTVRMMESSPDYYEESTVFEGIQDAVAQDYDLQEVSDADLQNQLYATTATWGLKYWESGLGIPVKEYDSYEERRGRVIAKLIGEGNFSAKLLLALAQGYGQTIRVAINPAAFLVTITFMQGIPPFLEAYQEAVENLVHAHLGVEYKFEYYINFGAALTVEYARYVYSIPFTAAFLVGTYPDNAVMGRQYSSSLPTSAEELTVSQDLPYSGTLPFVATDGLQVTSGISAGTEETTVAQNLAYCNTVYSGGVTI